MNGRSSDTGDGTGDEPVRQEGRAAHPDARGNSSAGVSSAGVSSGSMTAAEFADRFRADYRTLWTIAAGIVNDRSIAEDVVQEAALTALGKLADFEPNSNFTAWMAKIVRFLALNQSRRGKKQPASVDPVSIDGSRSARTGDMHTMRPPIDAHGRLDLQNSPFDDQVLHALNSVGEIARACLLLRTIQGLNYEEISRVLDIPAGTAMSHVHRARLLLRERLSDIDPSRTTGQTPHGDDSPATERGLA